HDCRLPAGRHECGRILLLDHRRTDNPLTHGEQAAFIDSGRTRLAFTWEPDGPLTFPGFARMRSWPAADRNLGKPGDMYRPQVHDFRRRSGLMAIQPLVRSLEARIKRRQRVSRLEIQRDLDEMALSHIADVGERAALSSQPVDLLGLHQLLGLGIELCEKRLDRSELSRLERRMER